MIDKEKIEKAIDDGLVQWQIHTMYNRNGLVTQDIREAVSVTSEGVLSAKEILDNWKKE